MAKTAKKKISRGGKQAASRGGNPVLRLLWWLVAMIFAIMFYASLIMLLVGMLPTIVARIIDRSESRMRFVSVGGLNLAGLSPYLISLWFGRNDLETAAYLIFDPLALLVIYGLSAVGWVMYNMTPPLVGAVLEMTSQRRMTALREKQRSLVTEWGPEITSDASGVGETTAKAVPVKAAKGA
ncbi:MAG: hypothetical protein RLN80_09905, partial [Rhodospirillales bacterium]